MRQSTLGDYAPDPLDKAIRDMAMQLKEERIRPIPDAERYPAWWGRLRSYGQSPQSLAELDYHVHTRYHRDDREEWNYEQHFAEIHYIEQ